MELHLQDQYFKAVQDGTKTIEGRLAKEKYRSLKAGEKITFIADSGETLMKTIEAIHIFPTFKDAFRVLKYQDAVPGIDNMENAVKVYESFYPMEEQQKYNVVFLKLI